MFLPVLKELRRSNLKSIYFNFKCFAFRQAILLPVRIKGNTSIMSLNGKVIIDALIRPGMIQIGYGDVGVFDSKRQRVVWNVRGKLIFKGNCYLGHGTRINVTETGILTFGDNVNFTAQSAIDCQKEITFGNNCLVSWENLFIDGDYHKIFDSEGKYTNPPQSIFIGKHVWFGCRCLILKGVNVEDNCVVAAGSLLNGKYTVANAIIAGTPAKPVQ